jgi:hypothetical protein
MAWYLQQAVETRSFRTQVCVNRTTDVVSDSWHWPRTTYFIIHQIAMLHRCTLPVKMDFSKPITPLSLRAGRYISI